MIDTAPLWFVPERVYPDLKPGDIVKIMGFRQFSVSRDGNIIMTGNVVVDAHEVQDLSQEVHRSWGEDMP